MRCATFRAADAEEDTFPSTMLPSPSPPSVLSYSNVKGPAAAGPLPGSNPRSLLSPDRLARPVRLRICAARIGGRRTLASTGRFGWRIARGRAIGARVHCQAGNQQRCHHRGNARRNAHYHGFWPQQLAVAWDRRPDRRTRRALLHLPTVATAVWTGDTRDTRPIPTIRLQARGRRAAWGLLPSCPVRWRLFGPRHPVARGLLDR